VLVRPPHLRRTAVVAQVHHDRRRGGLGGFAGLPAALTEAQVTRLIEGVVVGQVLASQRVRTWSGAASRTVWDVAARCHQIKVAV
jgi:hypothetical protein